jgi:hypothetical protein
MRHYRWLGCVGLAGVLAVLLSAPLAAAAPESKRLERAKDLIADEQWVRAVDELKAAAADPKEPNKDEALFWLAHSYNQAHDAAAAVDTIRRLERDYPSSRWVKPARSLRVEIAERFRRDDVLWWTAVAPPPPPTPVAPPPAPSGVAPVPPRARPVPTAEPAIAPPAPPPTPRPVQPAPRAMPAPPPPPPPPAWMPENFLPDLDLRIQALGSLMTTDALRVIPMLREIALETENPGQARRVLVLLAQSGRADARSTVVDVARLGAEPVRIAAVRVLGRLSGDGVPNELLRVYSTANHRVKYEVVTSLGQRDAANALMQIVRTEPDRELRDTAVITLGAAGGLDQLRVLYTGAAADLKRPIILGLFNAHAEEELIRIAERERDPAIREEALTRLRLLGTPRAKEYLQRAKQK